MNEQITESILTNAKTLKIVAQLAKTQCEIDPIEAILNLDLAKSVSIGLFRNMYEKSRHRQIEILEATAAYLTENATASRIYLLMNESEYYAPAASAGAFLELLMDFILLAAKAGRSPADVRVTQVQSKVKIEIADSVFESSLLDVVLTSMNFSGEYAAQRAAIMQEIIDDLHFSLTVTTGGNDYATATYTSHSGPVLTFNMQTYAATSFDFFAVSNEWWAFVDELRPNVRSASFMMPLLQLSPSNQHRHHAR